ncbi:hypothetical protein [Massilia sp. DD77]|uniref:hypothetical protein n=1 Tax=Massilia sp. DD77 TaxID=3109349 RepID=UPI002FFFA6E5
MDDTEIISKISEGDDLVRRELQRELRENFEKEKKDLLERANLLFTVTKWALASLAVIFTLFGIKAWSDIRTNVEEFFQEEIGKKYKIDDDASPINRTVEQLLDRAVVNALYMEVHRLGLPEDSLERRFRMNSREGVTPGEIERLLKVAKSNTTENAVFEDVIDILDKLVLGNEQRNSVASSLAEIVRADSSSAYGWAAHAEEKRHAIISKFENSDSIDAAASELISKPVSERLKTAALARIGKSKYAAAAPALLKFIEGTDESEIQFNAISALAAIRPTHGTVTNFILTDLLKRSDSIDLLRCVEMAAVFPNTSGESLFWLEEEKSAATRKMVLDYSIPLLIKALNAGVTLNAEDSDTEQAVEARIKVGERASRSTNVNVSILSSIMIDELFKELIQKNSQPLAKYVAAFGGGGTNRHGREIRIYGLLRPNSAILLKDGTPLTLKEVPSGEFRISAQSGLIEEFATPTPAKHAVRKNLIFATWINANGLLVTREIAEMKQIGFAARIERSGKI